MGDDGACRGNAARGDRTGAASCSCRYRGAGSGAGIGDVGDRQLHDAEHRRSPSISAMLTVNSPFRDELARAVERIDQPEALGRDGLAALTAISSGDDRDFRRELCQARR